MARTGAIPLSPRLKFPMKNSESRRNRLRHIPSHPPRLTRLPPRKGNSLPLRYALRESLKMALVALFVIRSNSTIVPLEDSCFEENYIRRDIGRRRGTKNCRNSRRDSRSVNADESKREDKTRE